MAEQYSIHRSDAMLSVWNHLERESAGANGHDIIYDQSFFEHALKYNTTRSPDMRRPHLPQWYAINADPNFVPYVPLVGEARRDVPRGTSLLVNVLVDGLMENFWRTYW
ncbi:hypothetical protein HDV05_003452 [Chytridiales sp. JEL 0842]|nr:hypothetical protein HDV05_003452 [Chytridiales sp. JEL 0842]